MPKPSSLLPNEVVVWSSEVGDPNIMGGILGMRRVIAGMILFFFGGCGTLGLAVERSTRPYAFAFVALVAVTAAIVFVVKARMRVFLTNQRVIHRGLFGQRAVNLSDLRGYQRVVYRAYDRYGNETIVSTQDVTLISHAGYTVTYGPVKDIEPFTAFLDGISAREIDPSQLRAVDGANVCPAEARTDILFVGATATDGDVYGPLVMGPRGLVRWTESLPIAIEGRLLTALKQAPNAEDAEAAAVALARTPGVGHSELVDLSSAEVRVDADALVVSAGGKTKAMAMRATDVERARTYVDARLKARPYRAQS